MGNVGSQLVQWYRIEMKLFILASYLLSNSWLKTVL